MSEPYIPKVNDYVIWDRGKYGKDEGWVYFFSDEYITIETGVKPKPPDQYTKNDKHKYIHTLLLCYESQWSQLKFVKRRESKVIQHYSQYDDVAGIEEPGDKLSKMYKSQEGRLPDY